MSDLTLIRAGHTQVADGQCGLCDTSWPCDTGVVLAALDAEQRARYEVDVSTGPRFMIDLTSGEIEDLRRQLAAAEARAERERDAAHQTMAGDEKTIGALLVENQNLRVDLDIAQSRADGLASDIKRMQATQEMMTDARLRERLATVEAALIRLRAGCMVSAGTACRLCHGTWLREDGETAADHHDGCPLRETAPGAALAATPAAGDV